MSFLRPGARTVLRRYGEAGIGAAVSLAGLWYAIGGLGILRALGVVVAVLGGVVLAEGLRRARLPDDGGGPGVVEVDERQITYFGPDGGGAISVEALAAIEAHSRATGGKGRTFDWVLHHDDGPPMIIPSDATGARAIFDALTVLRGVDYETVIRAANAGTAGRHLVWSRPDRRLH